MTAGPGLPANAETLFRAVAAAADVLIVVDAAGRITFLNPAALKILGYRDADELLGRPAHETIHYLRPDGSRFPTAQCPLLRPSRTGETVQLEQDSPVRKDGTQVAVSYLSAAVDLSSGRGVVVAFRDISARLRLGEVEASGACMSRLQPEIEATVCCIAAEATANAVKHGNAGHANIAVARTASALQLAITDDGTGGRPPYPGEPSRRPDSRDSWPP